MIIPSLVLVTCNKFRNGIAVLKKVLCIYIPMIPLREIGLKSARANKEELANLNIQPADPDKSKFKRNVIDMKQKNKRQT